jgi:hypothetical protein
MQMVSKVGLTLVTMSGCVGVKFPGTTEQQSCCELWMRIEMLGRKEVKLLSAEKLASSSYTS